MLHIKRASEALPQPVEHLANRPLCQTLIFDDHMARKALAHRW